MSTDLPDGRRLHAPPVGGDLVGTSADVADQSDTSPAIVARMDAPSDGVARMDAPSDG
ncbi:MAG: hypothetical protein R8G01_17445 [Ilumatobacteraceae bacterium]|nr:hypothetical protein [Ilumatobacteraceae bacterium]